MTAWKYRWVTFHRNWAFIGACYAMDKGVYPSGCLTWTRDWAHLYRGRAAHGRPAWDHSRTLN